MTDQITTTDHALVSEPVRPQLREPAFQAFWLLRIGFTVAPILFGVDKFAHVLTNWDKYLAPEFADCSTRGPTR